MKHYVTDQNYNPLSDSLDSIDEAAQAALQIMLDGEQKAVFVTAMESESFRSDVPIHMNLIIRAGYDLTR